MEDVRWPGRAVLTGLIERLVKGGVLRLAAAKAAKALPKAACPEMERTRPCARGPGGGKALRKWVRPRRGSSGISGVSGSGVGACETSQLLKPPKSRPPGLKMSR